MNVVPFAMKYRVISRAHDDVQVTGRPAIESRVAFARDADALAVPRARFNPHFQLFAALDHAFAAAHRAPGAVFPSTVTPGTHHVELHAPAGLRDFSFASALGTGLRTFEITPAVAVAACIATRDAQAQHRAPDRLPESHVHLVLEIGAGLGAFFSHPCAAAVEHSREDVAERSRPARAACGAGATSTALK